MDPSALKVALVGNGSSVHVQRWISGLRARGHETVLVDLRGRRRTAAQRVGALLRLRAQLAGLVRRGYITSLHYLPRGVLASALRGIHPLVVSVWGDDVTWEVATVRDRLALAQQRRLLASADAVCATSTFLRDVVHDRYGREADVVPFGVNTKLFAPPTAPRNSDSKLGAVFVKWLEPKYGADVLLDALALMDPTVPIRTTIAGTGPLGAELRQRAARLGVAGRVEFVGMVDHERVPALLRRHDIFVMPSRWEEFGVAAAEAASCGLPVIATRVGGIPEIVQDGITGLLVPPDDPHALAAAISRLAGDPQLRRQLGMAGRERIQKLYEWNECVARMECVYRLAAGRTGKELETRPQGSS